MRAKELKNNVLFGINTPVKTKLRLNVPDSKKIFMVGGGIVKTTSKNNNVLIEAEDKETIDLFLNGGAPDKDKLLEKIKSNSKHQISKFDFDILYDIVTEWMLDINKRVELMEEKNRIREEVYNNSPQDSELRKLKNAFDTEYQKYLGETKKEKGKLSKFTDALKFKKISEI